MGETYHGDGSEFILTIIGFIAVGILYIIDTLGITIEQFVNLLLAGLIGGFLVGVGIYVEFRKTDRWMQGLAGLGTGIATPAIGWWAWLHSGLSPLWAMVCGGVLAVSGLHLGLIGFVVGSAWWQRRKRNKRSSGRSTARSSRGYAKARQRPSVDHTDHQQSDDPASPSNRRRYEAMKREQERINRLNRKP